MKPDNVEHKEGFKAGPSVLEPEALAGCLWHKLTPDEALGRLLVTQEGLETSVAHARRAAFGPNVLPVRKKLSLLVIYLRQFMSPLVYLLLVAAAVSLGVGEMTDAAFIFVVLQANAVIGTYQEHQAETSAAALDVLVPNFAVVVRDGVPVRINAEDLVPGDIVRLVSGARVPADLRLLTVRELTVDESLLTGESVPVEKDASTLAEEQVPLAERRNMLYAGTTVLSGRVTGAVVGDGGQDGSRPHSRSTGPAARNAAAFGDAIGAL